MNNAHIEISSWLNSERNYEDGVYLYDRYGRNQQLKRLFPGRKERYADKLAYELGKLIGIGFKTEDAAPVALQNIETIGAVAENTPVPAGSYPAIINRVIAEYSRLYNERSMLKNQQNAVPDENTQENIAKRKKLIDQIDSLSVRMEILYQAKKAYLESGVIPSEDKLFPAKAPLIQSLEELPKDKLMQMRNNLRSQITRIKNQLEYQSSKKAKELNPMPECPKRKELEQRITDREKELAEIEEKLRCDVDRTGQDSEVQ